MAKLGSVITAVVTPFDDKLCVNEEAAVELMNFLLDNGSDGLVICGTTGESPTLRDEEEFRLMELAAQEVGNRCTIIAGTGSNDPHHTVMLTARATEIGVDGTLVVTPY